MAFGPTVGGLINVNRSDYRITSIDNVPGWNELVGSATFVEKRKPIAK